MRNFYIFIYGMHKCLKRILPFRKLIPALKNRVETVVQSTQNLILLIPAAIK